MQEIEAERDYGWDFTVNTSRLERNGSKISFANAVFHVGVKLERLGSWKVTSLAGKGRSGRTRPCHVLLHSAARKTTSSSIQTFDYAK